MAVAATLIVPLLAALLLTVLPPPREMATSLESISASLLTTLPVPAESSGLGVAVPVPTVVSGSTWKVTPSVVV